MNQFIAIVLMLFLLVLSGVFAMAETALLALRPSRVAQLVEEGRSGAASARRLLQNPTRFLAACQVGTTLLGFGVAAFATKILAPRLGEVLSGQPEPTNLLFTSLAVLLVALGCAGAAMVLSGLVPKTIALRSPDVWALRLAPLVEVCSVIFAPFSGLSLALSRLLIPEAKYETPMVTREEFEKIAQTSGKSGEIDDVEAKIITNVIDLSETPARAVMTPRIDMTAVEANATFSDLLDIIIESGHSRIPVFEGTFDNIIGVIHAKDLFSYMQEGKSVKDFRNIRRDAYFVNETVKISELLREMRQFGHQMAIVQDEYAGTEGIITIEDLLEEIVGDIRDEHDRDEPDIMVVSRFESIVDGRMPLADVNDRLGTHLEFEDYDTIGGLVFGLLGHEPEVGERVEAESLVFVVEAIDGRRIKKVRVFQHGTDGHEERETAPGEGRAPHSNLNSDRD